MGFKKPINETKGEKMKPLLYLVILIVFFLVAIRYIERNSIYFPMREITATPKEEGLDCEDVYFKTSDNMLLNGWFIPNDKAKFTLIFAHGNAGNIGHRIDKIILLRNLDLEIFIFDYRGYGKSEGRPSEEGLYKDIEAAYNYLVKKRKVPERDIILFGESIGGAVAIDLAHKTKVRALITEETFTSIKDMSRIAYPFLPHFVFSSRFDCISKIKNTDCAKLIIHSIDDEIIPFYLGEKLFNIASPPKRFLKIRGSHNAAFFTSEEEFAKGIKSFLDSL